MFSIFVQYLLKRPSFWKSFPIFRQFYVFKSPFQRLQAHYLHFLVGGINSSFKIFGFPWVLTPKCNSKFCFYQRTTKEIQYRQDNSIFKQHTHTHTQIKNTQWDFNWECYTKPTYRQTLAHYRAAAAVAVASKEDNRSKQRGKNKDERLTMT